MFRDHRGLTQEQLANAAGVSQDLIREIETSAKSGGYYLEHGHHDIPRKIAGALGISVSEISDGPYLTTTYDS
jgi:transcriptional regulator with XRE-family HTH domain